jgi:hypothetical protein
MHPSLNANRSNCFLKVPEEVAPLLRIHPKATGYLGLTTTQDYENGKGGVSAYVDAGAGVEFAFLFEPFD